MPSDSSLKAFLSSLSPEDVATLFAGLRNTLPIGMGVYSPELNAGEAEIVGKRQAEREAARVREMEILTRLLPQAMAKRQAAIPESGADPFVPTRPRIMRESPFIATQPRATPVPQQYAMGGEVTPDHTQPDMSDGGRLIADPDLYAGGGSVFGKKSLDQMQAELLNKEGLSRRALFGLKPDYPLAKTPEPLSKVEQEVKRAEQAARSQGQAPSVTASRVDVDPGTGRKKSVMESVTETPMSRRTVLKTAGSQVAQNMLPMGDLMKLAGAPAVTSPVGAIAQAARVAAPALPVTMESVLAGAIGQGMRKREAINEGMRRFPGQDFEDVEDVYRTLKDPYRYVNFDASDIDMIEAARPAGTMRGFIGAPSDSPLFSMRPYMRALKQASPEVYGRARTFSKDTAESAIEDLIDRGVLRSEDEIKRFLRNDPEIFEIMGNR